MAQRHANRSRHAGTPRRQQCRAVPAPGLRRYRPEGDPGGQPRPLRLAVPLLPGRQGGARRGRAPSRRRDLPGAGRGDLRRRNRRRDRDRRTSSRARPPWWRTTDFADACPIATVALEVASTSDADAQRGRRGVRVVARRCSSSDSPAAGIERAPGTRARGRAVLRDRRRVPAEPHDPQRGADHDRGPGAPPTPCERRFRRLDAASRCSRAARSAGPTPA